MPSAQNSPPTQIVTPDFDPTMSQQHYSLEQHVLQNALPSQSQGDTQSSAASSPYSPAHHIVAVDTRSISQPSLGVPLSTLVSFAEGGG